MAALAGETIIAGKVPGERIATTVETSDGPTFTTTETVCASVTAPLVDGRTYRVRFAGGMGSDGGGDRVSLHIREDNVSGTELQSRVIVIDNNAAVGYTMAIEAEHTASATGDKTFVFTGRREAGANNHNMEALSTRPCYLYVDYIQG